MYWFTRTHDVPISEIPVVSDLTSCAKHVFPLLLKNIGLPDINILEGVCFLNFYRGSTKLSFDLLD